MYCLLLLASCGNETSGSKAPIYDLTVKDTYTVKAGDSLYSIAWLYNLDYIDLAKINKIKSPYGVVVGQAITLYESTSDFAKPKVAKNTKRTVGKLYEKWSKNTKVQKISWQWPTASRVFKSNAFLGSSRGIDIATQYRQNIYSAASGTVVYNGSGIKGYGNLVIIKHSNSVLTAYGYSSKSLVQENQKVHKGQKIALAGKDLNGKAVLHFEIRENGKSISPIKVLPAYKYKRS
jgi:murein DD-endopeptidase MepM/ murein hydrolase activator NlpD